MRQPRTKQRSPERQAELDALVSEQEKEMDRREDAAGERKAGKRSVGKNRSFSIDHEFDEGGSFHDLIDDGTSGVEVVEKTPALDSVEMPGRRRARKWSKETIIEAIQRWNDLYGEAPATADWNPAMARSRGVPNRSMRYINGYWPGSATVQRHFGTWNAAIEAAGLASVSPGPRNVSLSESGLTKLSRKRLGQLRSAVGATDGKMARVGPADLQGAIRRLAVLDEGNLEQFSEALLEVAAIAVAWSDRVGR